MINSLTRGDPCGKICTHNMSGHGKLGVAKSDIQLAMEYFPRNICKYIFSNIGVNHTQKPAKGPQKIGS